MNGLYQVSNLGEIKSLNFKRTNCEKILKKYPSIKGYPRTCLRKNGITKFYLVHRLVAQAFIPNPHNLLEVNHKDANKKNSRVDNLEWCTRQENVDHSILHQLRPNKYGKDNPTARTIYQIDIKTNEILNIFYGTGDIKRRTNFKNPTSILKCCKNRKNYKTAYGYKWRFKENGENNE